MSTEVAEMPAEEQQKLGIVKLNVTDQRIGELKSYLDLTIAGVDDKEGAKAVYDAHQEVKQLRAGAIKYGKGLRDEAVKWQQKVVEEEKRVVAELDVISSHLQAERDRIEREKEAIKLEAERLEQERVQNRLNQLAAYGFTIDYNLVKSITDEQFAGTLASAKAEHERELAAKAEAERLQKEEQERLKKEREELEELRRKAAEAQKIIDDNNERIRKEQEEKEAAILKEQQAIAAEKKKIQDQKDEAARKKQRDAEIKKAQEEAAEKARLKAIDDARIAAEDAKEAERLAKAEEERQLALRPDKDKLQAYAQTIGQSIDFTVTNPAAQVIVDEISLMIGKMQVHILKRIKSL